MGGSITEMMPLLLIAAVVVGVMLVKKLIKWAIILGIVFFVALPYLDANGALDSIKSSLGL